jgi:glucose 1-dehydrogenase
MGTVVIVRLADRVAVITGGSSGIGRAIALRFAEEGARVVVGDVRRDPREGGTPSAALLGERGMHVDADVARWDDVDRLVTTAVEHFGRLDVMVCNAAISGRHSKDLLATTDEDWDAIMAVNLRGAFLCCKRAIAEMISQDPIDGVRGRLILMSSQHGMVGPPGRLAYAVSKGGVIQLTRQLAVDYGNHGIIVNAVAPGKIVTGVLDENEESVAYSLSRTPFPRLGDAKDVAAAVLFLATEASYVSGINLLVDGGWMAY